MTEDTMAIFTIIISVDGCIVYYWDTNMVLDAVFSGTVAVDNLRSHGLIPAWLFVSPAILIVTVYLVYPVVETLRFSFIDNSSENFVDLANYNWTFGEREFCNSIFNNLL